MPHSCPERTSFASSLNLFKDVNFPSYIVSSARLSLNFEFLITFPLFIKQPAITPIFGILNNSLTSASPIYSSTISGVNKPSSANLISSITS